MSTQILRILCYSISAVVYAVVFLVLDSLVPFSNDSVPTQWLVIGESAVVACVALLVSALWSVSHIEKRTARAKRNHPAGKGL